MVAFFGPVVHIAYYNYTMCHPAAVPQDYKFAYAIMREFNDN